MIFFWSGLFILFLYWTINNPVTHPIPKLEYGLWSIEEIQRPLLFGMFGHNFLILRDEKGNIISELHGLATNESTGQAEFVTMKSKEKLKVWEFEKPKYNLLENKFAGKILTNGDKEKIISVWGKAQSCADEINKQNISYPSFGFMFKEQTENSNSVAYTLCNCMGIDTKHLGLMSPGDRFDLLKK